MKLDEYKRTRSFFDHGQMLLIFQNSYLSFFLSFSKSVETFEPKFHKKAYGNTRIKIYVNGLSHMAKMTTMPIYGTHLKIFFSCFNRRMALKLGMYHWVLQYYQDYSNDDLGLILTFLRQG